MKMDFIKNYDGVADFFRRATPEEIKIVLKDAAQKANEDQRKIYEKYIKTNDSSTEK